MKKPVNSSSASVNQNSFGSRSGLTFLANRAQHTLDLIWIQTFDTEGIPDFFYYFSEKGHFEENQMATLLKSHTNLPSM